jgi:hypothetical protein
VADTVYVLKMIAYNGFNFEIMRGAYKECRERAKRRIAWYERKMEGQAISLSPNEWELNPPDTALTIGDCDGFLKIVKIQSGK